jgi:hypothetical protein
LKWSSQLVDAASDIHEILAQQQGMLDLVAEMEPMQTSIQFKLSSVPTSLLNQVVRSSLITLVSIAAVTRTDASSPRANGSQEKQVLATFSAGMTKSPWVKIGETPTD